MGRPHGPGVMFAEEGLIPLCHQAAAERERLEETLRAAYMPSLPCRKGGLMWWPPSSAGYDKGGAFYAHVQYK